jgi:hypothetical protein
VHARVDAHADDHRHERDGDRREAPREDRRDRRGPEGAEGEGRHHRAERAQAAKSEQKREGGEDHRQRARDREIPAQHGLGGRRDGVPTRQPEGHAGVRRADVFEHALRVGDEGLRVRGDERLAAGLDQHEARVAIVRGEAAVRLGGEAAAFPPFERGLHEAQGIGGEGLDEGATAGAEQQTACLGKARAHPLGREELA